MQDNVIVCSDIQRGTKDKRQSHDMLLDKLLQGIHLSNFKHVN